MHLTKLMLTSILSISFLSANAGNNIKVDSTLSFSSKPAKLFVTSSRCKKAEDECFNECEHHLGKDRMDQGTPYRMCWKQCMERKGCR